VIGYIADVIRHLAWSAAACGALIGAVRAQRGDPGSALPRDRAFGRARQADGGPWVGATVVLLARPLPGDATVGAADRIEVRTDASGQFRAEVAVGRSYSVWAVEAGEDAYRVSGVVEGVVARHPIVLTAEARPRPRPFLQLDVTEGVLRPLRLRCSAATANLEVVELEAGEGDRARAPVLPPMPGQLEILDADGVPLVSTSIRSWPDRIDVPPRRPTRVVVRRIADGAGAGAAQILWSDGSRSVPLGRLDADGCGTILLPAAVRGSVFVQAERCAVSALQLAPEPERAAGPEWPVLREDFAAEAHAYLGAGVGLRGRVLLGPGRPAAGVTLVLGEHSMYFVQPNSRNLAEHRRSLRLPADGRFELRHLVEEFPPTIALLLDPEHLAALPARWRIGVSPLVPLGIDLRRGGLPREGDVFESGDLDLSTLVPVRLRVERADGTPALGADIELLELRQGPIVAELPMVWRLDRAGEQALLLPRQADFVLMLREDSRVADVWSVSVAADQAVDGPVLVTVRAREPVVVRGRITGPDGAPRSGAMVRVAVADRAPTTGGVEPRAFGPVEVGEASDGPVLERWRWVERRQQRFVHSAADGGYRIELPPLRMSWRVQVGSQTVEFAIDDEGGPGALDFELGG
jgi:hypothetical protein